MLMAALRRHEALQAPAAPRLSVFQLVQLAATALLAVGLITGLLFVAAGGAVLGAAHWASRCARPPVP